MARLLSLTLVCTFFAVLPAKAADIIQVFNVNGTVGDEFSTPNPGPYTGDAVTGTVTIDTTTGVGTAINIDVSTFDLDVLYSCSPNCVFGATNPFLESGELAFGTSLVGYTGGSLASASNITLGTVEYYLTGTVAPTTPEPSSMILSLSGMAGLGLASFRRRWLAAR